MKIKCFYLRRDDENGQEKRRSDVSDAKFLCRRLAQDGQTITDQCAEEFQFGFYHMLELRQKLSDRAVSDFIFIGGRKLIQPWGKKHSGTAGVLWMLRRAWDGSVICYTGGMMTGWTVFSLFFFFEIHEMLN
ncbi:hypothetical protein I7I48_04753 [Histoplasma ohiense]|nr:hypothetical protein I7I48_04753 [Histoplasma ohiense (nom. inval.)]